MRARAWVMVGTTRPSPTEITAVIAAATRRYQPAVVVFFQPTGTRAPPVVAESSGAWLADKCATIFRREIRH